MLEQPEKLRLQKINQTVTKKVFGKQKAKKINPKDQLMPTTVMAYFDAIGQMLMIFPAIFIGLISGISAFFSVGIQSALDTFNGKVKR